MLHHPAPLSKSHFVMKDDQKIDMCVGSWHAATAYAHRKGQARGEPTVAASLSRVTCWPHVVLFTTTFVVNAAELPDTA